MAKLHLFLIINVENSCDRKYDWVSKDTKLNANGWSNPLICLWKLIRFFYLK